ncbi:uncharacterized protein LOC119663830, partial [Teleopsis dalmanni]|uniref:uncharacterized protein LOC119663830 n=1 Tax=Teleopsis dalmanni TaxID=139649 RepID=UPI0018CED5B5
NDSKTTATIFSIRNTTHNLYLESCKDGLRLYLERDNTTEMLPVKFNLYDYRWHQVAISIQNGDFISVFVDCSWTNSFIVSKRLFSLPLDADVEIGRGFNVSIGKYFIAQKQTTQMVFRPVNMPRIIDDNGFQSFFMGILPDISPLNAKRKRFLKMKILELINELNEEQESEEHFISYESEESL